LEDSISNFRGRWEKAGQFISLVLRGSFGDAAPQHAAPASKQCIPIHIFYTYISSKMIVQSVGFNCENDLPSNDLTYSNQSSESHPSSPSITFKNRGRLTIDVSEPKCSLRNPDYITAVLKSPSALERISYIEDDSNVPLPPGADEVLTPKPRIKETRLTMKPRNMIPIEDRSTSEDWYMIESKCNGGNTISITNHIPFAGVRLW
jgi:hypothetical protein